MAVTPAPSTVQETAVSRPVSPFYRRFRKLGASVSGQSIQLGKKGYSGAGHGKGDKWAEIVEAELKKEFGLRACFAHYEYLNHLLSTNPRVVDISKRKELLGSPVRQLLLKRSDASVKAWDPTNLFVEKQDDTADYVVSYANSLYLVDVKSREMSKKAQAPNLISGLKLAHACRLMIESGHYDLPELWYFGCEWQAKGQKGVCENAVLRNLRWADPESLYVNFTAGRQIQGHLDDLDQSFYGTTEEWARAYLKHFIIAARAYQKKLNAVCIEPFQI